MRVLKRHVKLWISLTTKIYYQNINVSAVEKHDETGLIYEHIYETHNYRIKRKNSSKSFAGSDLKLYAFPSFCRCWCKKVQLTLSFQLSTCLMTAVCRAVTFECHLLNVNELCFELLNTKCWTKFLSITLFYRKYT
jgi:hypothetical protein